MTRDFAKVNTRLRGCWPANLKGCARRRWGGVRACRLIVFHCACGPLVAAATALSRIYSSCFPFRVSAAVAAAASAECTPAIFHHDVTRLSGLSVRLPNVTSRWITI